MWNKVEEAPKQKPWRLGEWYPEIGEVKLAQFRKYDEILNKFNQALNLVSAKTLFFSDVIHFADSILGSTLILDKNPGEEIYDFGSGNGFPGIVLCILAPNRKIHLIESDSRKVEFLKHVAAELGLENANIQMMRVEDLPADSVSFAVSRGFLPLTKAVLLTRKVIGCGGHYYHFKGEEWGREIATIPSQVCSFWIPSLLGAYKLPVGGVSFAIVDTQRIS